MDLTEMMGTMSTEHGSGMAMPMMQDCIEACSAAAMAAIMCADADTGEEMMRCGAMCANVADVATATMHMMLRPSGYDPAVMSSMLTACATLGQACAAECRMHADMHEHCRICAQACEAMVDACRSAMAAIPAA